MKVADLQQHLADLGRLLASTGVSKVATDLAAISNALGPFREQQIKAFAEFLVKAESYSRGAGPHPTEKPARARTAATRAQKAPALDVEALARQARDLYDRAASPLVTVDQIEAFCRTLDNVNGPALKKVAAAIDLTGVGKKKNDELQAAIRNRILQVKGSTIRAGMTDRPALTMP